MRLCEIKTVTTVTTYYRFIRTVKDASTLIAPHTAILYTLAHISYTYSNVSTFAELSSQRVRAGPCTDDLVEGLETFAPH